MRISSCAMLGDSKPNVRKTPSANNCHKRFMLVLLGPDKYQRRRATRATPSKRCQVVVQSIGERTTRRMRNAKCWTRGGRYRFWRDATRPKDRQFVIADVHGIAVVGSRQILDADEPRLP